MKYFSWPLFLVLNYALNAQQPNYTFYERFDVENGLPQNLVSGIVQDDDGFIWVSTMDGLARYDGKEFLVFRHQPNDNSSLSFNALSSLFKDRHNSLWVQFNSHTINKIDPRTFQITKPKPLLVPGESFLSENEEITGSYVGFWGDEKNWLWFQYDKTTAHINVTLPDTTNKKLETFLNQRRLGNKEKILAFSGDANGKLWLVTRHGFEVSDERWENFKSIPFPERLQFIPENRDTKVQLVHLAGERAAVAAGNKLILYNHQNGRLKTITPEKYGTAGIEHITKDIQGRLVFEYNENILRLEHSDRLTHLWKYPGGQGIRSILIDRTNTLWVGTDPDGLYKVNLLTPAFVSRPYRDDFITDVLINEVGIDQRDIPRKAIVPGSAYYSRYVHTRDQGMFLFLEMGDWFHRILQIKRKKLVPFYETKELGQLAYGDKKIWFLDNSGYLHRWSDLKQPPVIIKTELPTTDNGFSTLNGLLVDGDTYWVSTPQEGIYLFKNEKLVKTIRPQGNYSAHVLAHDPRQSDILWIGTVSGGLYKWDKAQDKLVTVYNTENGLPNNTINSIVSDPAGCLWMSTNKGISRFNPATETFTHYTVADGLIESEFNRHHAFVLPDGRIAMGGTKGYSVFDPETFGEDTYSPEVFITRMGINDQWIDPRSDSLFPGKPDNRPDKINLSYNENSIAFRVAATQFNAPEKNKYRYKLEGFNRDWVNNGTDNRIRFNQLPSGRYTLLLNASNTSGVWSPEIRKLSIIVRPPFWLTWWAYSFYIILTGIVVRAYWQGYKKRLKAKQEAAFNVREAARLREVDEIKTRFFSNITHEFRTPLTLILSPLEKHLNDQTLPPKALALLNNNYRHANQLLTLVNQLLDIAKIEAGQMPVNQTAGELKTFTEQLVGSFQQLAASKQISLQVDCDTIQGHYLFDHEKWETILVNLLSNAIKFTPPNGSVQFEMKEDEEHPSNQKQITLQVRDSGIGIPPGKLTKIFERFYQADDSATRKHEGTGIGLSLVKELVDLMKGALDVESEPGKGTVFSIRLPAEKLPKVTAAMDVETVNGFLLSREQAVPGTDHEEPLLLVVEDNDELRAFVRESLSTTWKVLEASNGLDGWAIIERELPEIVVSDVMMPGMNGFELCAKTKADIRTAHIGFIMLTARAAHESKIKGLEAGADEYLSKPFHLYELELRIRNLLQEQHSVQMHLREKLNSHAPLPELPHVNDVFLAKLNTYLEENLNNSKLNIETVADAMAMSKSTLNRKLKVLLDSSISEYIKKYRLQKACVLLSAGLTVSEVSFRVGFETSSYFAQCFKEHYRQTPTEFIKAAR